MDWLRKYTARTNWLMVGALAALLLLVANVVTLQKQQADTTHFIAQRMAQRTAEHVELQRRLAALEKADAEFREADLTLWRAVHATTK